LRELLTPYRPGACPVTVVYLKHGASYKLELGNEWRVNLQDNLLQSLASWLNEENVQIVY
jgi:DNA polymerase III subunit alpha